MASTTGSASTNPPTAVVADSRGCEQLAARSFPAPLASTVGGASRWWWSRPRRRLARRARREGPDDHDEDAEPLARRTYCSTAARSSSARPPPTPRHSHAHAAPLRAAPPASPALSRPRPSSRVPSSPLCAEHRVELRVHLRDPRLDSLISLQPRGVHEGVGSEPAHRVRATGAHQPREHADCLGREPGGVPRRGCQRLASRLPGPVLHLGKLAIEPVTATPGPDGHSIALRLKNENGRPRGRPLRWSRCGGAQSGIASPCRPAMFTRPLAPGFAPHRAR